MSSVKLTLSRAVCFLLHFTSILALSRIDLSGNEWLVSEKTSGTNIIGKVPGSQYTALLDHTLIPNPLYRDNDVKLAWIGNTNWTYSTNFTASFVSGSHVVLVCEGLETIATVWLNGKVIGKVDNMFVRHEFDISGMVQGSVNTLIVDFSSTVLTAEARANHSSYDIPPDCPPAVQHGQCHVNQVRTEQCSFSWDWGPSFPSQGIWRPIYIDSFDVNSAIMRDLSATVAKAKDDSWQVNVEAYFDIAEGSVVLGQLDADIMDLAVTFSQKVTITSKDKVVYFSMAVPKDTKVPLWWPNGYGSQPLFTLNATFVCGSDTSAKSLKIGFRTVELVQEPVTNYTGGGNDAGLTFYFKVNDVPIFLKGSNWIPADSFQERITRERLQYLLSSAANVSINSMRVWGGGIYESDALYDICDELGILVWQDLMFSVALYPTGDSFLQSVATEVTQQVRRLKHHASILIWAGNNENEKALRQDWFDVGDNYTLYYNDYINLYVQTIKPILEREDTTRLYLTSSPSDGLESVREGYVAQDPGSELYGDIHFYDYALDQWNATAFRIPRMASEYGIQSWCNNESLAHVFEPADFDVDSRMVNHRQHHALGNTEMMAEVSLHLQLPTSWDPALYFAEFIYLTQINQAMSMRTQTEHYRRYQSTVLKDGRGLTMGALYWQLNDIWQAPTWASIDYEGRWKMLHYFARSFFHKHLISPFMSDTDTLDVFIVVDEIPVEMSVDSRTGLPSFTPAMNLNASLMNQYTTRERLEVMNRVKAMTQGQLKVTMYQYSSFSPLHSWTVQYSLKTTAESVFSKSVSDLLSESGCPSQDNCFLTFSASDQSGTLVSSSWFLLTYPKDSMLKAVDLKIESVAQNASSVFDINVSSDAPALFVWLSAGNILGHFSDNGFIMTESRVRVQFYPRQSTDVTTLQSQLRVRCVENHNADPINSGETLSQSTSNISPYILPGVMASLVVNGSRSNF